MCSELSLTNGAVEYIGDNDGSAPYDLNTRAVHSCNEGYTLDGQIERNCNKISGENVEWDGSAPTCHCKDNFA